MSKLIEGLERIEAWLKINMPDRASELRPGLSDDDIREQVNDLPFSLPEEIYELYGWHNGNVDRLVFENYDFLPLKAAIGAYYESLGEISYRNIVEAYFFEKSFPVFQLWSDNSVLLCVICDNSDDYPIRMIDVACKDYSFRYRNLTDLILHVAEWYESSTRF
jgi:SMI1 / KNR4 family (SUKH-1)